MPAIIRPGFVASNFLRSGGGGGTSLDVYAGKHYVLAKPNDGLRVKALKHYVLAKPV